MSISKEKKNKAEQKRALGADGQVLLSCCMFRLITNAFEKTNKQTKNAYPHHLEGRHLKRDRGTGSDSGEYKEADGETTMAQRET